MPRYIIPLFFILSTIIIITYTFSDIWFGNDHPKIYLDRDRCSECGMVISTYLYSVMARERDSMEWLKFDDIGCFIKYLVDNGVKSVDKVLVYDYIEGQWIDGFKTYYIKVDPAKIQTPMSSGLIAVYNRSMAYGIAEEVEGEVYTFEEIVSLAQEDIEFLYLGEVSN